jgi:hypothetical protein
MKNLIYMLFLPMFMMGQSSGNNDSQKESVSVSEKKQLDKTAGFIEKNFSKPVINAYQNRAIDKVNEFYNYLILLQNATTSDLQNELKQNIKLLLINENLSFQNIVDFQNKKETIDEIFIQIIEKKLTFSMPIINQNPYMNHNDFEFLYTLAVEVNKQVKQLNLTQKVYLFPLEKQFGTTKKTVWELKLGAF